MKVGLSLRRSLMKRAMAISRIEARKGNPPYPRQQYFAWQGTQVDEHSGCKQRSGLDADERQGGEEAATPDGRVFCHQHCRAGLLRSRAEPLQKSHEHQ